MVRAIFFDRDGVINDVIDRGDNCVVKGREVRFTAPWKYEEFKINDGVNELLKKLKGLGFLIILTTNQPDICYGTMAAADHEKIMAEVEKLPFDDIFVCPHGREDGCVCKKPKPGMLLAAANKYNIDLTSSFMIGDTKSDIGAGKAVGCTTVLLEREYNMGVEADIRVAKLIHITGIIK